MHVCIQKVRTAGAGTSLVDLASQQVQANHFGAENQESPTPGKKGSRLRTCKCRGDGILSCSLQGSLGSETAVGRGRGGMSNVEKDEVVLQRAGWCRRRSFT